MSPYEIDVALWYHARPSDHPDLERNPPIWRPTIDWFLKEELLTRDSEEARKFGMRYFPTSRLKAFVYGLQQVPLPSWTVVFPGGHDGQ